MNSALDDISFDDDGAFLIWKAPDPISKLLAIEGCRMNSWFANGEAKGFSLIIIRSEQCMACLARYWHDFKQALVREHSTYIEPKRDKEYALIPTLPCFINII